MEKRIKTWGILFLITFIACFLSAGMEALATAVPEGGPAQEEPVTGVPIENTTLMYALEKVNVRSGPGTDTEILGELAQGEMVFAAELLEEGWYRIVFGGETGYVRQDFLAVYGTAGEWEAPGQPAEPDVAGQDSAVTGKKTVGNDVTDDDTENAKTPASAKKAKDKKGNVSTIIIIAVAVLLILGYSVIQIVKEKQKDEEGDDEDGKDGQEPQAEAWDEEEVLDEEEFGAESSAEWEEGEIFTAEDSPEQGGGENTAAAGYAENADEAENSAEDELVILDIDEI